MPASSILNPHDPAFDRFLQASVGRDHQGSGVTVLSALARLNLDPWQEAEDLARMRQERAGARLSLMLSRLRDVPTLGHDHLTVAHELTRLLPARGRQTMTDDSSPSPSRFSWGMILAVLALVFLVVQIVAGFTTGAGE